VADSSDVTRLRPASLTTLALLIAGAVTSACTSPPGSAIAAPENPLGATRLWHQYTELPALRALFVAGDPERVWVAGMAGGMGSLAEARREALAACERQRARRRMKDSCQPYAEGEAIIWRR